MLSVLTLKKGMTSIGQSPWTSPVIENYQQPPWSLAFNLRHRHQAVPHHGKASQEDREEIQGVVKGTGRVGSVGVHCVSPQPFPFPCCTICHAWFSRGLSQNTMCLTRTGIITPFQLLDQNRKPKSRLSPRRLNRTRSRRHGIARSTCTNICKRCRSHLFGDEWIVRWVQPFP